ncbi:gamma-glutamylcyclotransferase family protein [Leptolyngbya sp. CCNP1308]|uniref:gamma-glutamylcyclotransferase family protein n=1 Tax=Leptolyngbya sp. CCNP1308 TaxID=3110255 RepID=UPI002B1F5B83|nr:gamma-glutamylcyclotransferase family protein [Leptolyngbya sp. CCNP1308]MEA5448497.1 gamma-glutamylcyclotransferase family protein [Leptolyngbya sp. CCNP1308]
MASPTPLNGPDDRFYYFAYGSCMCPVDLKRSLGESTHAYVIGPATLDGYRLGFFRRSRLRNCGVLDVVPDPTATVQGVLYYLPWRLSPALDLREEGYCHETVTVIASGQAYAQTRTYSVISKTHEEIAPNEWYSSVVMRGAATCGLPEQYCWELFHHIHSLQRRQAPEPLRRTA